MKKGYLILVFTIIFTFSNFTYAQAKELTLGSFFDGDIARESVSIFDANQDYEFWSFQNLNNNNLGDLIDAFSKITVKPKKESIYFEPSMLMYEISYYRHSGHDNNKFINVYKGGFVTVKNGAEDENPKLYKIDNFYNFKNQMDLRLSTKHSSYRQRFLSKNEVFRYSDWAKPYIKKATDYNLPILPSVGNMTKFITRELFCDMFTEVIKKGEHTNAKIQANKFLDTVNPNVEYLYEREIIKGKSKNNFAPNDFITREEGATIIYRVLDYIGYEFKQDTEVKKYADDDKISDWAKDAVYKLRNVDVMIGMDNNEFSPKTNLTKEQAIKMAIVLYEEFIRNASK